MGILIKKLPDVLRRGGDGLSEVNRKRPRAWLLAAAGAASLYCLIEGIPLTIYRMAEDGQLDGSDVPNFLIGALSAAIGVRLGRRVVCGDSSALKTTTYDLIDLAKDGIRVGIGRETKRHRMEFVDVGNGCTWLQVCKHDGGSTTRITMADDGTISTDTSEGNVFPEE
jgi:hypothetical protein